MSVEGLCQLCEAATATHQCSRCASLVCSAHYDTETGMCTECVAELDDVDSNR